MDELYPDLDSRINRIAEIDLELAKLNSDFDSLRDSINELSLEKDILVRIDLLEKVIDKKVKITLKNDNDKV